jgi:hypothetical protein
MKGDDAVLLAMDTAGLDAFVTAINHAEEKGAWRLDHGGVIHDFRVRDGVADIELHDDRVLWRLDRAKTVEIIQDLTVLRDSGRPGPSLRRYRRTDTDACAFTRRVRVRVFRRHSFNLD